MEASVRLRKDNPNLADLSDALRPTKLAEKYTELYDNNWTDAFEELHDKCSLSEGRVIKCLLKILMVCFCFQFSLSHCLSWLVYSLTCFHLYFCYKLIVYMCYGGKICTLKRFENATV